MKRRWGIYSLHHVQVVHDYRPSCPDAQWFWVRESYGGTHVIGCVCHCAWTKLVRAFEVVPDAPAR